MIFNKSNTGTDELRKHMGTLYKSIDFDKMEYDVIVASEDLAELIGDEMFKAAEDHYKSNDFQKPDATADQAFLDKIVLAIQAPIAFSAYSVFSQSADITHESTGRKVAIDPEREKIPFEWLLIRDEEATLNKAHKATERLLKLLDSNIDKEPVKSKWGNSDAYKLAHSLFINSAAEFDKYYPIDKSRRLFLKLCPFIDDVELKFIKPILGETLFAKLKSNTEFTEDEKSILPYIKTPLAQMTIAIAIKRLPIEVLPNGIFQNIESDSLTQKGKKPATIEFIRSVSALIEKDADEELKRLAELIAKMNAIAAGLTYTHYDPIEEIKPENKFLRL